MEIILLVFFVFVLIIPYLCVKQSVMKRVYIGGAISADNAIDVMKNIHRMIYWGNKISKKGFAVFIPALDVLWQIQTGDVDYDRIFANSQPWLDVSDAVFLVPGWENSPGTKKEIKRAKKKGVPVIHDIKYLECHFREKVETL